MPAKGTHFAVYKITKRRDEDITAALGAFHLKLGKDGKVAAVRIAYGGMAATPKRAGRSRPHCLASRGRETTVEAAIAAYAVDFTPLTDMRASAEYRALAGAQPAAAVLRGDQRHQGAAADFAASGSVRAR